MNLRNHLRKKLLERYDTSGVSNIQRYYYEQFYYGHREVLLTYLDLPMNMYLKAVLSHGNIYPDSFDPLQEIVDKFERQILQIVTRADTARIAVSKGIDAISIGSIGLYALHNYGQSIDKSRENIRMFAENFRQNEICEFFEGIKNQKILYMPFHSWEGDVVSSTNMYFENLARNKTDISVCLGYLDFINPDCRNYYNEFSNNLTCAGMRSSEILESPAGGRANFLYNLFRIIEKHDVVVADEMTTGIMYAILLGKKVRLFPSSNSHQLDFSVWRNLDSLRAFHNKTREIWPWLEGGKSSSEIIESDIVEALGVTSFATPENIKDMVEFGVLT